jgi:hypothetical protein
MSSSRGPQHNIDSSNLADLLERVLDKGVVIAGDVKVKIVDIELLTIQIRLVICSVDKAKEMGMDWWANSDIFGTDKKVSKQLESANEEVKLLRERLESLEKQMGDRAALPMATPTPMPAGPDPTRPESPTKFWKS